VAYRVEAASVMETVITFTSIDRIILAVVNEFWNGECYAQKMDYSIEPSIKQKFTERKGAPLCLKVVRTGQMFYSMNSS